MSSNKQCPQIDCFWVKQVGYTNYSELVVLDHKLGVTTLGYGDEIAHQKSLFLDLWFRKKKSNLLRVLKVLVVIFHGRFFLQNHQNSCCRQPDK